MASVIEISKILWNLDKILRFLIIGQRILEICPASCSKNVSDIISDFAGKIGRFKISRIFFTILVDGPTQMLPLWYPSVPLPHTYILNLIALWRAGRGLKGEGPKIYDLYSTLNHQAGEFFFNSHHLHSE